MVTAGAWLEIVLMRNGRLWWRYGKSQSQKSIRSRKRRIARHAHPEDRVKRTRPLRPRHVQVRRNRKATRFAMGRNQTHKFAIHQKMPSPAAPVSAALQVLCSPFGRSVLSLHSTMAPLLGAAELLYRQP